MLISELAPLLEKRRQTEMYERDVISNSVHRAAVTAILNGIYGIKVPNLTEMASVLNLYRETIFFEGLNLDIDELFKVGLETKYKNIKHRKKIAEKLRVVFKLNV